MPAGFRSVKVETGLASDTYVEITSGLSEGDVVYVAESSKNSSSFMMMMDGGMGSPTPAEGGNMGGQNRGGSEAARTVKVCPEGPEVRQRGTRNTWTIPVRGKHLLS